MGFRESKNRPVATNFQFLQILALLGQLLVGACLPQTLLRTDEEELCQFDAIPPTYREKQSVPDCWVSVKQFSKNDTATACQDWLRSTRLGRGSIKSHVRTVKVLGMGLFAFQERIHLWKGVTH